MRLGATLSLLAVLAPVCACSTTPARIAPPEVAPTGVPPLEPPEAPWHTAPEARPSVQSDPVLVRGATIWLGDGNVIPSGHVSFQNGKLTAVGAGPGTAAPGARIIDGTGKFVTPGLIDTHSHMGVYPVPHARAHSDGNEATSPVTSEVRAIDGFWPQDPAIERALAGGVTTILVLPGSANLIGGRAFTAKLRPARTAEEMRFRGAPPGLKMACGENPKRVYGSRSQAPSTRMGNLAGQRRALLDARQLIRDWQRWRTEERRRLEKFAEAKAEYASEQRERAEHAAWCEQNPRRGARRCAAWREEWDQNPLEDPELDQGESPPARDPQLETLAAALEGRVLVHVHCYRADDIARMLALADEVALPIRAFHHGLEAYKVAAELARRRIAVATWADWWGFKLEAYDGIEQNVALLELAGAIPVVHSDSPIGIQRLNQEAAKALWAGRHAGLDVAPERAITWITSNAARTLGVERWVGTLEPGKDADVVVWSSDPLSVYASAELVFVDGLEQHRLAAGTPPRSDFEAAPQPSTTAPAPTRVPSTDGAKP